MVHTTSLNLAVINVILASKSTAILSLPVLLFPTILIFPSWGDYFDYPGDKGFKSENETFKHLKKIQIVQMKC
jgi:hypothetical protein